MQTLEELGGELGAALQAKSWQLALAESCTGGMVSQAVTAIAGSSAWFDRGFVTYSNAAKEAMLGIPATLIAEHGAVSEAVAQAMASGALQHSLAHISGAITGIAGPGGGTLQKPVGMVCFGWAARERMGEAVQIRVETQYFAGTRTEIREQAASYLLAGLLKQARAAV